MKDDRLLGVSRGFFKLLLQPFRHAHQSLGHLSSPFHIFEPRFTDQSGGALAAIALKLLVLSANLSILARCDFL